MQELGIHPDDDRLLEVWNKADQLSAEARERMSNLARRQPDEHPAVLVSAKTGEGIAQLIATIEDRLARTRVTLKVLLDVADGAGLSWLYRNAEVLARE